VAQHSVVLYITRTEDLKKPDASNFQVIQERWETLEDWSSRRHQNVDNIETYPAVFKFKRNKWY
jgi:hypothetical protein